MNNREYFNGIESLDHPVIAVQDLGGARRTWERLGFVVPPRGSHVEWGTGNLCIMFYEDYIELRGIIDPSRFVMNMDRHLDRFGEGLMGVAFRTEHILSSYVSMSENGIRVDRVRHLTRNFEHPDGWTQPSFELCAPEPDDVCGLMHVLVLEHLTPELLRRPEFVLHPNGCQGISGMAGTIHDVARVAGRMRPFLGDAAVSQEADGVILTLPTGQRIELLLPARYEAEYGPAATSVDDDTPRLGVLILRVNEVAQARTALDGNGVLYRVAQDGAVNVDPAEACGTRLVFADACWLRR